MAGTVIFSMNHCSDRMLVSTRSRPPGVQSHERCGTYSLATIGGGHISVSGTVLNINPLSVRVVGRSKGNSRVDVVLGLIGAGGVGAVGVLLLDGRVPQLHGAGRLGVAGQDLAGDGVGHGLLPEVAGRVGEGVVDDDAVVVVDIRRPLVADELDQRARVVLAVHLGRHAPRRVGVGARALARPRRVRADDALDQVSLLRPRGRRALDADPGEQEALLALGHLARVDGARRADDLRVGRLEAADGAPAQVLDSGLAAVEDGLGRDR